MFEQKLKKIKNFIKQNYKLVLICIVFIFIFNINVPYYIYNGGGIINISERISIKKHNKMSNINMTYVSEMKSNFAGLLMSFILPNVDREKIEEENYNSKVEKISGKLELEQSVNNSKIAVFNLLNKEYKILNHKIVVSYIDSRSKTNLIVGDRITKVNNNIVKEINDYKELLNNSNVGDILSLEVINNGKKEIKEITVKMMDNKKLTGIVLVDSYNINSDLDINYSFKEGEYGSSGGLMMALALYDKLNNDDIVKNRIICGTGTIDIKGIIGEIGGVKYKIAGAVKNKCDVFLTPVDNYKEALKEKKKNKYKIQLYKVNNLDEAVTLLLK